MRALIFPLILFLFSNQAFAASPASLPVGTYEQLLQAIRQTQQASQTRIEQAVDREKVREAWETGKLIDEHILQHKERADYGQKVIERLAVDLGMSHTELKYMLEFFRTYPIGQPTGQLSWSHYIEVLSINDAETRKEVTDEAVRQHWSTKQLRQEVRKRHGRSDSLNVEKFPTVKAGKIGNYLISKNTAGELFVDLGFSNYLRLAPKDAKRFKEGDIINSENGNLRGPLNESPKTLFTYRGTILEIIDGDTLRVEVELGFGFTTVQKLRLRALDAPELISAEGQQAKKYIEKLLSTKSIILKTQKSDKYDRYLADVWNERDEYVNQKLVDEGLAVGVNE